MGGIQLFHSIVAVGNLVITIDISGPGVDPSLLEELTARAVARAVLGALSSGAAPSPDKNNPPVSLG